MPSTSDLTSLHLNVLTYQVGLVTILPGCRKGGELTIARCSKAGVGNKSCWALESMGQAGTDISSRFWPFALLHTFPRTTETAGTIRDDMVRDWGSGWKDELWAPGVESEGTPWAISLKPLSKTFLL